MAAVLVCALVAAGSAGAQEIFSKGTVSCSGLSPLVTALEIDKCKWKVEFKKHGFSGRCLGTLTVDGVGVEFLASGAMYRIDQTYADNGAPLGFTYPGLASCTGEPKIVRSVQNCVVAANGLGQSCDICIRLARVTKTYCYAATASITQLSPLPRGVTLTPKGLVKEKAE
jgi:hypothetical protein